MAKLRSVNTQFWTDEYVQELSPTEKYMFLYLLTNPLCNICGIYKISTRTITFETGLRINQALGALKRLEFDGRVIYRDGWIVLKNFLKNQNLNANMEKGVIAALSTVPEWILGEIIPNLKGFETIRKAFKGFDRVKTKKQTVREVEVEVEREVESEKEAAPPDDFSNPHNRDLILANWLDEVAKVMGAKSRFGLTHQKEWTSVCKIAVTEGYQPSDLTQALKKILSADNFKIHYFKPEKALDGMRLKANGTGPKLPTLAEKQAADDAQRKQIVRPPAKAA